MSEKEEKCKLGTVNYQGMCWKKKRLVEHLILGAKFDLSPPAREYIGALDLAEAEGGIEGVDMQIAYIMANLVPETETQNLVMQQLDDVMKGQNISTELKKQDPNIITEVELERIMMGFERYTESKVDELHRLREQVETPAIQAKIDKLKLTMEDFVSYSKTRTIPVDKVLVAQGWVDDVLADEVLKAKKEAEKRITIEYQ